MVVNVLLLVGLSVLAAVVGCAGGATAADEAVATVAVVGHGQVPITCDDSALRCP